MRNQTPLAPREPFDVTVHLVLNDFGPLGRAYIRPTRPKLTEPLSSKILSVERIRIRLGWSRSIHKRRCAGGAEKGAERTPLNVNRHAGVFSEDTPRGRAFRRVSSSNANQGKLPIYFSEGDHWPCHDLTLVISVTANLAARHRERGAANVPCATARSLPPTTVIDE